MTVVKSDLTSAPVRAAQPSANGCGRRAVPLPVAWSARRLRDGDGRHSAARWSQSSAPGQPLRPVPTGRLTTPSQGQSRGHQRRAERPSAADASRQEVFYRPAADKHPVNTSWVRAGIWLGLGARAGPRRLTGQRHTLPAAGRHSTDPPV